jgi:hypothetical protein
MWSLLKEAWPAPLWLRPYCWVTAVLGLLVALLAGVSSERATSKVVVIGGTVSASVLLSLAVLAVGGVWRMRVVIGELRREPPRIAVTLINAAAFAYLAVLPALISAVPGCWGLAVVSWLLGAWFGWWSVFLAGMSVTGDWI